MRIAALLLTALVALGPDRAGAAPPPQPRDAGQVVRIEHRDPDTVPTLGPASALVTVEYFFQPNTRLPTSYRLIQQLQSNHPRRVRVIFRVVKRGGQVQLPTAALEAHAQGKFFELMTELQNSRTAVTLSRTDVLEVARRVGMDVPRLAAAIANDRYRDVLDGNDRRFDRLLRGHSTVPNVLFNVRPPRSSIATMSEGDFEREYDEAFKRAHELIDHGADPTRLYQAFDALALRGTQPFVITTGPTDDEVSGDVTDHKLASPPLALTGLPSFGKPDARAPVPVALLCRPNDSQCGTSLRQLLVVQRMYADDVRLVWAPWFDVQREDATELVLLGDAALCAEQVGSSPEELGASPGWRWIDKQLQRSGRSHGRRAEPDKLIEDVAAEVDIDPQKLSSCRARMANATLHWIERARRSGVTRAPALIIGGRIYEGIPDQAVIQQLVEAELAPGVLGELTPGRRGRR